MLSPQSYQDLLKEAAAAGYGPTNHQRTSFKVVLVGDKGVGKSTFIKRPIL
jgi:GTPase SAR1 family protein